MPLSALLLADGRTPTGGYAHSGGLEAAIGAGLTADDVPALLRGRLHTVALTEAALTAAAVRAAAGDDIAALLALDDEAAARCPSPVLRRAASALGRSLLRTAAVLWPADLVLPAYRGASAATPRPVALGVAAAAGGLGPVAAATVALHGDAATVVSAAVKLLPVDAAAASAWLAALASELEQLAEQAARACAPAELPSAAAPLLDLRSLEHLRHEGRLFAT